MSKPPKAFDVWFMTADTVYKGVPYNVVADWAQDGRLAPNDRVRPTGTKEDWQKVADHEFLADYLPRPISAKRAPAPEPEPAPVPASAPATAAASIPTTQSADTHVDLPDAEPLPRRRLDDEDDEVDMIPLIDVSLVLLVFFIIMRAASALAPIDVPEMKYAGELKDDPTAITILVDKKDAENIKYAVRVGQAPARPAHDNLQIREQVIDAVKELVAESQRPPELRIACHHELPRERVYELRRDLQKLQKAGDINTITATVIEAQKK